MQAVSEISNLMRKVSGTYVVMMGIYTSVGEDVNAKLERDGTNRKLPSISYPCSFGVSPTHNTVVHSFLPN